jgi:hypothetical protein
MKTKLDFYHMTPFYELNYFIAFIVKLYKRIQQRKEQKEHRIKDDLIHFCSESESAAKFFLLFLSNSISLE